MAEDILGISGQMDISDIQQSFDKLINDLNSLGVKTDEVSSKMTKALNDIAQSSASDSEKTKQSVQTLKQGIEEINKSLADTPEALKKLASEAQTAEVTVDKLKKKLSETTEGSQKWNEINEQLKSQQSLVEKLNGEYSSMLGTFGSTQQYVGTLNAAIDTLNAGRSISTATTGANATAHVGAAAAVGTEAVAHGENSTKIAEETEKTQENTQAKLHLTESAKDYVYTTKMEAEAIDAVAKRLAEGRSDEEEYINSKKSGLAVRESLVQKIEEEKQKIKELSDAYANSQDANNGVATPETQKAYNEGVKEATDNIKEYRNELSSLNQSLDNLESSHFKAQQAINGQTDATQNLKQATEEAKETSDIYFNGEKATIEGVTEALKLDYQELKQLKAEYANFKGAGDTENAKKNLEEQKELNKHIAEGRDVLKQLGTSYEEAAKGAKKAKEETKKINKEVDKTSEKLKGLKGKFKDALKGALKGDFSGLTGFIGKIGIWGAAAVGAYKGVKYFSKTAQELKESLMSLKTYVDSGTLKELREQFVALEYDSSHSAEEMAAGATRWVKYFEGLRGNADAIADVTKSSNDFATILKTTTEKAADYQLKIAGAYHQTALEAKENSTIIINAAKGGTAKYEEMAQALSQAANRAQNAGVSLRELAAATTYGTNTFGSASEAANAYVMMMTRLSAQSKNEYNPSVVGATKALQNLAKSHEMNALLTNLLGKRQASLAKVFVQGAADIKKMQEGLDDEASAAKTLAGAESKIEEQEKRLANAKRALAHEINANLTPAYANFLEDCSSIIKTIGNWGTTIKSSLKSTLQWINSVDNAIKDSTIYKLFGTSTAELKNPSKGGLRLNIDKVLSGKDENSFWDNHFNGVTGNLTLKEYNEQRRKKIKEDLKKIYNQNLKKYGANSAGKAMMATLKAYNHNSEFDYKRGLFTGKEINDYVAKMVATTRLENKSKVKGESLAIGEFNSIPDSKGENKLKQLQEQQRKFREQEAEQEAKDLANTEKVKWDLYVAEKEAGIARLENASEKEVAQHKLDYEKQKHAIEEEAKNLLQTNIAAAKQKYEKNPDNKKKEGFYASGLDKQVSLTSDQKTLIQAKYDTLNAQEKAYDLQQLKAKTQSLYDYLKEYGTFKEQQLAIEKEYDEKIRAAESQGDTYKVKSLQAEKQKQIGDTKAKEIESRIDYTKVFGDFGVILREQMDDILKSMKAFSKTDTFKAKPIDEQKDFLSRMNELSNQYGTSKWKDINFSQLGKLIDDYNQKLKKRNEAEDKLNESSKKLADAQEEYENAIKSGDTNAKLNAKGKLGNAQTENDNNRKSLEYADANLLESQNNVTDSAQKLSGTLNSLDALLNNMKSGSISNVWNSFVDFDKKVNGGKATQAVTDTIGKVLGKAFAGKSDLVSQIIGAILTLLDTIAEQGIGGIVGGLIDSVLGAINGLLDNILSGKFLEQIGESLINGIGGIIDNVIGKLGSVFSFGALSSKGPSAWFGNSNAEKVEEAINNLTDRNKSLQQSIDDLNDTMKNSSGAKSVEAYKEAYKLQEEQNENYKKIAQEQAGYHGAHKSWNKYWGGFSGDEISRIKKITGKEDFNGNLWDLTPEEMKKLRGGAVDIWERIKNTGKGGYGSRLTDKLDDYIDQADKLQELTDQINESLTQVSFSSMKDDFISNLMDMEKNAEDFANDFSEMMQKSVLRYGLENLLNTDLKKLYEKWGAKMQEGNLSKDDIDNLKSEYDDLVKKGIEQRDYWAKITGYTGENSQSQQTATGKGIEAVTADQASSLIGIGYAVQSAIEVGNETRKFIQVDVSSIRIFAEQTANNISEMRDIQYQGLEQLEAINKNTAPIILIREDIASMYKLMKENY